jgi:hypothetical protein
MTVNKEFAVRPPGKFALWLPAAMLGLVMIGILFAIAQGGTDEKPVVELMVTIPVIVIIAYMVISRRRVSIENGVLVVKATLHTHRVPVADLELDGARTVDLGTEPELRPALRMWGLGLPGFQAGYFWLKHDRKKAFCLLTARDKVLVLPEHSGRLILLSLERPQSLVDALRGAPKE